MPTRIDMSSAVLALVLVLVLVQALVLALALVPGLVLVLTQRQLTWWETPRARSRRPG